MILNFLARNRYNILYGFSLALLLFLFKWLELRFLIINHSMEVYIGSIAVLFTALGIWLAQKLTRPREKTIVTEQKIYIKDGQEFTVNEAALTSLGLSRRELEVLELMAGGLSNQEIAARLFVSLNTVKTHSSKLFEKMDVKRRTQAIDKAKKLGIIA